MQQLEIKSGFIDMQIKYAIQSIKIINNMVTSSTSCNSLFWKTKIPLNLICSGKYLILLINTSNRITYQIFIFSDSKILIH